MLLSGFFVAAEYAIMQLRGSRYDPSSAKKEGRRAAFARSIAANPEAYQSACRLGSALSAMGLGWFGAQTAAGVFVLLLEPLPLPGSAVRAFSWIAAVALIAVLLLTVGGQLPKAYAIRKSEQVTNLSSGPLVLFYRSMSPIIRLSDRLSGMLFRLTGLEAVAEHAYAHTEDELRGLVKASNRSGLIDNTEMALVDSIFEFSGTTAREIMIPRTEMICLYSQLSFDKNKSIAVEEMHTRYPVCDPDKDNIIGFVHIKDLLRTDEGIDDIRKVVRAITKVPESMQISALLKLMQKKKMQMALLIDEYGGTSGLVTFEDIIEQIVGEVQDEFDEERPQIERLDDGSHSIDGRLLIEEVNSYFGLAIASDDYDTIGGWIYSQVDIPPKKNQCIVYDDAHEFVIDETDHLRVTRIVVRKRKTMEEVEGADGTGNERSRRMGDDRDGGTDNERYGGMDGERGGGTDDDGLEGKNGQRA